MGVMLDKNGTLSSGRNDKWNSNFIGSLTLPGDGDNKNKTEWTVTDGGMEWPDKKYYDIYNYSESDQEFNKGLVGDATKELGLFYQLSTKNVTTRVSEWNADSAFFVFYGAPWFTRGGSYSYGTDAGIFAFIHAYGRASFGFRMILTP